MTRNPPNQWNIEMPLTRAVRIEAFGGPEKLQIETLDIPAPRDDEVLLKVHAASVNPVDYKIREGKYPAVTSEKLPYTLGRDVSGIVEACGTHVPAAMQRGAALYAMLGVERGGYEEYVIVKTSEAAPKPRTLDHVAASAVPLAGLTAWQGLFDHGGLGPGQRVLIHGGTGGVGHFAVQFAKTFGAYVVTTASREHVNFALELGADDVIDYESRRFEDEVGDIDLVYDLIGGETQERSFRVLKRGGRLVSTLTAPDQDKAHHCGIRALRYTVKESGADLEQIGTLIDAGKVKPKVSRTFPLDHAREAQIFLKQDHPAGKVVLRIAA